MFKNPILLTLIMVIIVWTSPVMARVSVMGSYTEADVSAANSSVNKVISYFQDELGFDMTGFVVTVQFNREVRVPTINSQTGEEIYGSRRVVSGYYDAEANRVHVLPIDAPRPDRSPWGLTWTRDTAQSVLDHEFIHAALAYVTDLEHMDRVVNEYITYAMQHRIMNSEYARIVRNSPKWNDQVLESWEVNYLSYSRDTEQFGIAAYNTVSQTGDFNRRILEIIENPAIIGIDTDFMLNF